MLNRIRISLIAGIFLVIPPLLTGCSKGENASQNTPQAATVQKAPQHVRKAVILPPEMQENKGFVVADKRARQQFPDLFASADNGDADAQYEIGMMYLQRKISDGEGYDYYWLRKAALQGHSEAQYQIGAMLSKGGSAKRNKSIFWLKQAAEQGNAKAQLGLGYVYGDAIDNEDLDRTTGCKHQIYWYQKAIENGNDRAKVELAKKYCYGVCVGQNEMKAITLFWDVITTSSDQDDVNAAYSYLYQLASLSENDNIRDEAKYLLGVMHADGLGGRRKEEETATRTYLIPLAKKGHKKAQEKLREMGY